MSSVSAVPIKSSERESSISTGFRINHRSAFDAGRAAKKNSPKGSVIFAEIQRIRVSPQSFAVSDESKELFPPLKGMSSFMRSVFPNITLSISSSANTRQGNDERPAGLGSQPKGQHSPHAASAVHLHFKDKPFGVKPQNEGGNHRRRNKNGRHKRAYRAS